jgi:hypothetical protein
MDWLIHNPIGDMYGPYFLLFYACIIAVTLAACRWRGLRRRMRRGLRGRLWRLRGLWRLNNRRRPRRGSLVPMCPTNGRHPDAAKVAVGWNFSGRAGLQRLVREWFDITSDRAYASSRCTSPERPTKELSWGRPGTVPPARHGPAAVSACRNLPVCLGIYPLPSCSLSITHVRTLLPRTPPGAAASMPVLTLACGGQDD